MDFFAAQDRARAASRRLGWLFAAAVLAVVAAVAGGTWGLCRFAALHVDSAGLAALAPRAAAWAGAIAAGGILLASWLRWRELREGGAAVALMLGGTRLRGDEGPVEHRLVNVVEEMAIASGVPLPQVFVLRGESAINAFAAGHGPGDAAVAVTAGALRALDRDQLQGVVAHEFSHLLNGDMALNLRLMALLHGLLSIALAGRELIALADRGRVRRGKENPAILFIALGALLWLAGSVGHVCGQLIRAAMSRSREFLADAAAAQFTRQPAALASALALTAEGGALVSHPRAAEAAHLYFASGLGRAWSGWFATHPPLAERIARLGGVQAPGPASASAPGPGPAGVAATAVCGLVGTLAPAQVALGRALVEELPGELRIACIDPVSARAVAVALVMEDAAVLRQLQRDAMERGGDEALRRDLRRLLPAALALPPGSRLPLASLAMPALRQLLPGRKAELLHLLQACAGAVPRPSLPALARLRRFAVHLRPPPRRPAQRPLAALLPQAALLLSALAGSAGTDAAARQAFAAAVAILLAPGRALPFTPADAIDAAALGRAMDDLLALSFAERRGLVQACAWAVAADGRVLPAEGEWLSLAADALGCPLPPFARG